MEPLQVYMPKEEDIQTPLKKLEANSEGNADVPVMPESTVPSDNSKELSSDPKTEEPTTEVHPESEESPETENQNSLVETTSSPTAESVSDQSEVAPIPAPSTNQFQFQ